MGVAATSPMYIKDAIVNLSFDGGAMVDFSCHAQRAAIVPSPGELVTYRPLCDDATYVEQKADTFVLELRGVQDYSAAGLARLLWDNAGETVGFSIQPYGGVISATKPAMTGTARVVRGDFGGDAETWAEFEVELPIIGIPVVDVTP